MLYPPRHSIVATGDLIFNDHYPFLDRDEGGVLIPDLIVAIRNLADDHTMDLFRSW